MLKLNLMAFLGFWLAISVSAFGMDAEVVFVKGRAISITGKKKMKIKKGLRIPESSIVKTAKSSLVVLKIDSSKSKQVLKVNESSVLKLTNLDPMYQKSDLSLGSVFIQFTNKVIRDQGKKTKVRSPKVELVAKSVSMGVRGTQFFASFGPKGHKKDFWMCVNEGKVNVENIKSKKQVLVKEGEGIQVVDGSDFTEPKPYEWTKKLNWKMDAQEGDLENKAEIEGTYDDLLNQDYD